MMQYQVLYWRDIPAQIKVYVSRRPSSHPLAPRFQVAIDGISMQEGLTGSDEYLELWQWSEKRDFDGDAETAAETLLAQTEAEGDVVIAQYKGKL
jgi:hypothetical protein